MTKDHPNIWIQWTGFLSIILIYASLWVVLSIEWHLLVASLTLLLLMVVSKSPGRQLGFILGLIGFLVVLQLIFSSYMREMFLRSLEQGFNWEDWIYLLFAVDRLAWPLLMVSIFQTRLSDPRIAAGLSGLLAPLRFTGLNVTRLQSTMILALKFMPTLRREWGRLSYFQTYFTGGVTRKSLLDRILYYQGVLKAMIAHVVDRAVTTGDLLALRGLPRILSTFKATHIIIAMIPWLIIGSLTLISSKTLCMIWSVMTIWMMISAITVFRVEAR